MRNKGKWIVTIGVVMSTVILLGNIPHPSETENKTYAKTAIVTETERGMNFVTVKDANGIEWQFNGVEDYEVGDVVSMEMNDNGTANIYDDLIFSVRYSGFNATNIN